VHIGDFRNSVGGEVNPGLEELGLGEDLKQVQFAADGQLQICLLASNIVPMGHKVTLLGTPPLHV
jgi:hypothetical protein